MRTFVAFVLGSATVLLLGAAYRGATRVTPPQDPAEMAEMMKKARKYVEPGPHHAKLARFLGTWKSESRFIMAGQKSPPEAGRSEVSWLMEGRWLKVEGTGSLMGQEFENFILLGYDNFKQSYVMTSVNSVDTAMLRSEGDMTRDDGALVLYGTLDEYLTGEHDKMVKYVYRWVSDDEFVLEVHDLPIGLENTKVVEIRFTRE